MQTVPTKTYILLDHMNPTVPIGVQVSKTERVKLNKRKSWMPFIKLQFVDSDGQGKKARFKLTAKSIWEDDQIVANIPANAKFTDRERDMMEFKYGFLVTNVKIQQDYLEAIPQFDGFKGPDDPTLPKCYKIYDADLIDKEMDDKNQKIRKALEKIYTASTEELEKMLMRINGVWSDIPKSIEKRRVALADLLVNEAGIDAVLDDRKEEDKVHDERRVWVGMLVKMGILDFLKEPGMVYKKNTKGLLVKVYESSPTYSKEDQVSLFVEFLQTDKGKPIIDDLLKQEKDFNEKFGKSSDTEVGAKDGDKAAKN